MTIERYERTDEQNEELGLNDMVTENYGEKSMMEQAQESLQKAHLLEVGGATRHVYAKDESKNLLTPSRAAAAGGANLESRRTSAAKSAKSMASSSGANIDGSSNQSDSR